ncbi:MAG: glycosyltransferase family 4 protein [Prevotella sp.]|nr:glycosyltransferase family 4 protein [Prevotella sp.]
MIQACERQGIKTYVIMPAYCPTFSFFTKHGIECYIVNFKLNIARAHHGLYHYMKYIPRRIYGGLYNRCSVSKIYDLFKDKRIDVVHSNASVIDIGPAIAKKLKVKHVWHLREFQNRDFGMEPFRGWKRLLNQIHNADAVIAISNSIYRHFGCDACKKAIIQPNAVVDVKSEGNVLDSTKKQILFCGRICRAKCPDVAIRIFSAFHQTHPDYRMKLVGGIGSEEYKCEMMGLISSLKLENVVDIVGYIEDVSTYYKESRVFIMSSRYEAMGRVTIEAMFHGCIVLGYNSAGTAELVEDGVTGFLFDDEESAMEKLSMICDRYESDEMQKVRKQAYSFCVDNFSIDRYGKVLLNLYKGL